MSRFIPAALCTMLLLSLLWALPLAATETENQRIRLLPAAGKVTVDGKANDWDLSGAIFACGDVERMREKYAIWVHAMYDADNIYLLARWVDPTPLNHPGSYPGDFGFNADCLQARFIVFPDTAQQGVTWWDCWRDRKGTGVVGLAWPGKSNGISTPEGENIANTLEQPELGVRQAFQVNADGKGYAQELVIPWRMLSVGGKAPKAGDKMVMTVEPNFTAGEFGRISIKDIFSDKVDKPDRVFTFRGYKSWGTAMLEAKGKVTPQPVRLADGRTFAVTMQGGVPTVDWASLEKGFAWPGFKPITYTMPFDGYVSMNIVAEDGTVARQLLTWQKQAKGTHTLQWDGLSTPVYRSPGNPVKPGTYTVKAIAHPGVKLTMRGFADYGGKAPWEARPDTFWGGDHGTPSAMVTDSTRMYMAWNGAEGGRHVQATDFTGKFLWGLKNTTGAGDPDVIAVDNGVVYILHLYAEWMGTDPIISRASATDGSYQKWAGTASHILAIKDVWQNAEGMPKLFTGLDAKNGKLYATGGDVFAVLDGGTGKAQKTLPLKGAGFVRAVRDTLVYVIIDGSSIVAVDPIAGTTRTVVEGLSNAKCLNVDAAGNLYVSLWEPAMQVAIFTPEGKETRRIGRAGGRAAVGPWQADGLYRPFGLAVDKEGKLWVAEHDFNPKRISVWNLQDGTLVKELFGPTHYGASGGAILPDDPNVMVGVGCEWRIDPVKGGHVCTGVFERQSHSYATFRKGANGKTYLYTFDGQYGMGEMAIFERLGEGRYSKRATLTPTPGGSLLWTDANGDAQVQDDELQRSEGYLWTAGSNSWSLALGLDGTLYPFNTKAGRLQEYKVVGYTACGAPRYSLADPRALPAEFSAGYQTNYSCAIPDADGTRLLVNLPTGSKDRAADYAWVCFDLKTGKRLWSYPNPWFQVHGSHSAPAPEPGLFRGGYGPIGIGKLPVVGTVWVMNCNLGEWHMLTGDGFYLTPLFTGDPFAWMWPTSGAPGVDVTACPPGSGGEDFGGSMTQGTDGEIYLQAGKMALWNVHVENLDQLVELKGSKLTLTAADVQTAASYRDKALQAANPAKKLTVKRLTPTFTGFMGVDFKGCELIDYQKAEPSKVRTALAYDDTNLYLGYEVRDTSPWTNGSDDYSQIYVGGDTVDLQLGANPKADPKRGDVVKGDLRLAIGPLHGKPTAVLYKFIADEKKPREFTSGVVRGYKVDYVDVLANANVQVKVTPGQGYIVEAAIPWISLGITPAKGLTLRGDFGVTHGDEAGQRTRLRTYWANQVTGLVDDVVIELKLSPANWGEFTLE